MDWDLARHRAVEYRNNAVPPDLAVIYTGWMVGIASLRLMLVAALCSTTIASASTHRLIVVTKSVAEVETSSIGSVRLGGRLSLKVPEVKMLRYTFESSEAMEKARVILRRSKDVEHVYPDFLVKATEIPNDPFWSSQWGPQFIRTHKAWDLSRGLPSIKVAVIDSGIVQGHPDLPTYEPRWDYVDSDPSPWDGTGHGTHVTGIISARVNNGTGVSGVGRNCVPYIYRVLSNSGSGYTSDVTAAIIQASNDGCHVINLSLGSTSYDAAQENACNYAVNNGSVVCAAAGNSSTFLPFFPAYYSACLAVGSIDGSGQRSWFSNYGSWVDVAAPGSNILSTYLNNGYSYLSGTSMASPHVAGLAALAYSVYDWRSSYYAKRVRGHIQNVCSPAGDGWCYFGTVDAYATLARMQAFSGTRAGAYSPANLTRNQDICLDAKNSAHFGGGIEILNDNAKRIFVRKFQGDTPLWTYTSNFSNSVSVNDMLPDGVGGVFVAGQQSGLYAVWHLSPNGLVSDFVAWPSPPGVVGIANSMTTVNGALFVVGTHWITSTEKRAYLTFKNSTGSFVGQALDTLPSEGIQILGHQGDGTFDVIYRVTPTSGPTFIKHKRVRSSDLQVLSEQQFANAVGASIDANMMIRRGERLLLAAQVSPGDNGGSSGIIEFNRRSLVPASYTPLITGYIAGSLTNVIVAPHPSGDYVFTSPRINPGISSVDCAVLRLNSNLTLSWEWWIDPLGPIGTRYLRGAAFGDTKANCLLVTSNGEVLVAGAGNDDFLNGLVPTVWRITESGLQLGMDSGFGTAKGEFVDAELSPRNQFYVASMNTDGYQNSSYRFYTVEHRGSDPRDE